MTDPPSKVLLDDKAFLTKCLPLVRLTKELFLKQELSIFGQSGAHLTPLFLNKVWLFD